MPNNDAPAPGRICFDVWPRRIFVGLLAVDLVFLLLHVVSGWSVFNLDEEGTLPVWFSSLKLFGIGLLCVLIGRTERGRLRRGKPLRLSVLWLVVAAIFFFLSADETSSMHERVARVVMDETMLGLDIRESVLAGDSGKDAFAWVLLLSPGILGVAGLFVFFFYNRLRVHRGVYGIAMIGLGLFLLAVALEATVYLTPALEEWTNTELAQYRVRVGVEETGEMLGSTFFLFAFFRYWLFLRREPAGR